MTEFIRVFVKRAILGVLLRFNYGVEDILEDHEDLLGRNRTLAGIVGLILIPRSVGKGFPIFVHIPRNGGTSMSNALYGNSIGHFKASCLKTIASPLYGDVKAFALFRNPVERCLSAYKFIIGGGGDVVELHHRWKRRLSDISDFDRYLDYLEENCHNINRLDFVMREQIYFLEKGGRIIVDNVFLWDAWRADLDTYLAKLGIFNVAVENRSTGDEISLSAEQIARVESIYRRDVKLYRAMLGCGDDLVI